MERTERTERTGGDRSGWMSLGLLFGAWLLLIPAAVQAEPGTAADQAGQAASATVQQENLQVELKAALQRIESLEKQVKARHKDDDLGWTMMVEAGF